MLKLILIDLDGTLLKEHYILSQANIEAVEYAIKNGVQVGLNTGRNALSALLFGSMAGVNAPIICAGGSIILGHSDRQRLSYATMDRVKMEVKQRECIYESVLGGTVIEAANKISKATNVRYHACTRDGYYVVGESKTGFSMDVWSKQAREMILVGSQRYFDLDEFFEKHGDEVTKLSFSSMDKEEIEAVYELLSGVPGINLTPTLGSIIEVTAVGVDKGSGVRRICDYMNILPAQVGCIGDDTNDLPMFRKCGYSMAMSQGVDEIKEISDFVVDGCAQGIYKLIDGERLW